MPLFNEEIREKFHNLVVKEEEKFLQDGSIWVEVTIGQFLYGKKSLSAASTSAMSPCMLPPPK